MISFVFIYNPSFLYKIFVRWQKSGVAYMHVIGVGSKKFLYPNFQCILYVYLYLKKKKRWGGGGGLSPFPQTPKFWHLCV